MNWWRASGVLICAATVSAAAGGADSGAKTLEIGVRDRANANASIAASGTFVGLAWAARSPEGVTDVYAALSGDAGRSFQASVRVNHAAGEASVSGEQPPRVGLVPHAGKAPSLVVVWTAKGASGTRLVSARSDDGGRSFGAARPVPGSDASGNRGWESIAITQKGIVALWLDHREVPARSGAAASMAAGHQHGAGAASPSPVDGAARAQLSQLFFAALDEPRSARPLASGVCYCCKTSVAGGTDGSIFAAWRNVYPGNVRDIALTKSSDGGRTFASPVRVSDDNWVLDGCPENGPALAVDRTNAVHVVWPTLIEDAGTAGSTLALFYAMSKDGQTFTKRLRIPTEGVARHAQIAVGTTGDITIAWDEQVNGVRRIALARGTAAGGNGMRFTRESTDGDAGTYPVLAPAGDGTVIAWTSGAAGQSVLRVERRPTKGI